MLTLLETYRPRPIDCLELWQHGGWRIKLYVTTYRGDQPSDSLVSAAKQIIAGTLPRPAVTANRYGVGFAGIHDGRDGDFVFLDWWENENELHHHVWVAPKDRLAELRDMTTTGLAACVWDLAVICFERQAWTDLVLENPTGTDLDAYLARRLSAMI